MSVEPNEPNEPNNPPVDWEAMHRLTKDLRNAASLLTDTQARYFVDAYYLMQKLRIRSGNQVKALERDLKEEQKTNPEAEGEPHNLLDWLGKNQDLMEKNLRASLKKYADSRVAGVWAQTICGIGPVLSAGLLAHIDITQAPTVGHIWRFAGQDPTQKWEKSTKRPWNASLKTLCWKIGESFVKVSNNEADVYGKVYQTRKEYEQKKNEAGDYKDQAALGAARVGKNTDAYKSYSIGKLSDGHIHARAKRYSTKLFLAHLHHVLYEVKYGVPPPKPYIIEHGGHVHYIAPPNWPMVK